jgi:hypothetical protein
MNIFNYINHKEKNLIIISGILLKIALDISYIYFVSPIFIYRGFIIDITPVKYLESWIIYVFTLFIVPYRLKIASDFFIVFLFFLVITPIIALYSLANYPRADLYTVLSAFFLILLFRAGPLLRISSIKNSYRIALYILLLGILIFTMWIISSGALQFFNLDLSRVYEFRADAGEVINEGPMAYLNTWSTKVFGPMLLAYLLLKRKFIFVPLVFILHIFWFSVTGHKSVLFNPFIILFFFYWFKSNRSLYFIPVAMSVIIAILLVFYLVTEELFFPSLILRRVFFVPAHLLFSYYDFFSDNKFIYWSNSILSTFIENPYLVGGAQLIGQYLNTDSNANNSFLATGYMHFGFFGVILYSIIVGYTLRFLDSIASNKVPAWFAVSCLLVPLQALFMSADLTTAFLTHGVLLALLLLYFFTGSKKFPLKKYDA